jgi:hypothetical protein
MLTALPAFAQRGDFALLGLAFAGCGSAVIVSSVLPRPLCLSAALIAALGAVLGVARDLPIAQISLFAAVALGITAGTVLSRLGTKVWSRAGRPLVALGSTLGGIAAASAHQLGSTLPEAALGAMAIGTIGLLLALLPERTAPAADGTR